MDNHSRSPHLIPPHGGYRELHSCQMSEIVYDATVVFCDRFISKRSRTHDQMVQAARSDKQNYVWGVTGVLFRVPASFKPKDVVVMSRKRVGDGQGLGNIYY